MLRLKIRVAHHSVLLGVLLAVLFAPASPANALETRNWKFNKYDYRCNTYDIALGNAESGFLVERHFVYQGWNYERKIGSSWYYQYSWVYPFGQIGPAQITGRWEYVADFGNRYLALCPRR